jgi:SAM-dependent methyltransferase
MELRDLQRHWDAFGNTDPMWSVLTSPDKKHGRWDKDEFFRVGQEEIAHVLALLEAKGIEVPRGRALDFGCGVGRLSQALADHFDEVDGVDIAPSMIRLAEEYNRHGDRCRYHLNEGDDLRAFPDGTFDFIYSAHVLQHMEPRYAHKYVEEFVRVLASGGVAFFEITTERVVGATEPLPAKAFTAEVEIGPTVLRLDPGAVEMVPVRVTNKSQHTWPAAGKDGWFLVTVANHWLDDDGKRIVGDDGRATLPNDIAPGETAVVELEVHAPEKPGSYGLEVDLVQEGVAWFGDRGSTTASVYVKVRKPLFRRQPEGDAGSAEVEPTMEMYGTTIDEMRGWIEAAGGRLLQTIPWREISGTESTDWQRWCFVAAR